MKSMIDNLAYLNFDIDYNWTHVHYKTMSALHSYSTCIYF